MTPGRRGFTLIEMVVAGGLVSLLLGVLVMLLFRTSNLVSRSTLLNELQSSGEAIYRRMAVLCNMSDAGGASYFSQDTDCMLALHPVETITPGARKLYAPQVTVFAWERSTARLLMFQGEQLPESRRYDPTRLDQVGMLALLRQASPKVLSERITLCSLTPISASGFPLRLQLRLEHPVPHGPAQVYLLERSLCLRNFY